MYVQDYVQGINATAEISKQEASNFKDMCNKTFASADLHGKAIDEYLQKLSQIRAPKLGPNGVCSIRKSNYELSEASLSSLHQFEDAIVNPGKQTNGERASSSSSTNNSNSRTMNCTADAGKIISTTNGNANTTTNSVKKLEDAIKFDEILKSASIEMNQILTRSKRRIQREQEIIGLLTHLLTTFDSTIAVVPFGSATYGFGGNRTDFNILIVTGGISKIFQLISISTQSVSNNKSKYIQFYHRSRTTINSCPTNHI